MLLFEKYGQRHSLETQAEPIAHQGLTLGLSTLADHAGSAVYRSTCRSKLILWPQRA